MTAYQENTIYPCPFSKGYGIPVQQAWSLLNIFFIYRFIIASLFVILFYSQMGGNLFNINNLSIYGLSSQLYWLFAVFSGSCLYWRFISYAYQAQIVIFADIVFITLLMHASGGVNSGIGILLVVSIAAAGMLIGGRCAILFAALASLSVLSEQLYSLHLHELDYKAFRYAGMLGASFFTIAFLSYVLAQRTEQSEVLAFKHQQTIANLEELNQSIIQHLQSGVVISDAQQQVTLYNKATVAFINPNNKSFRPQTLTDISSELSQYFTGWLKDKSQDFVLITFSNQNQVHCRFSLLKTKHQIFYLMLLEDLGFYNQRLQQSKLASLGQLTASIAHEIRNPLGAISHAGQLLSESMDLSLQDIRLTEIIQSHCLRVNKIIEDVLQLSRREPSEREKIELYAWLKKYLYEFIMQSGCHVRSFVIQNKKEKLFVYMDEGHLKQILDNLCSNALKYGSTKKYKIILEIDLFNELPCLKVFDHGSKIDSEVVKNLFNPFFTTSSTGTGLGLYISKELAELNQASLTYRLINGENCFMLCLPLADSSKIEI